MAATVLLFFYLLRLAVNHQNLAVHIRFVRGESLLIIMLVLSESTSSINQVTCLHQSSHNISERERNLEYKESLLLYIII